MQRGFRERLYICLLLFNFLFREFTCVSVLPEYILQEGTNGNCDENISDLPSVLLRSHVGAGLFGGLNSYKADQECAVTFQTKYGYKILVQFPFFKLQPADGSNCTDQIVITEKGNGSSQETEICTKQDFASETEKIEVKFISDSSVEKKGFVATVTSFHEGACSDSGFKCDTTRCISSDLKCDGHDHCIDKADESNELAGCSIMDKAISKVTGLGQFGILAIAIVVGGVLFTVFISVMLWNYLKKDGKCCECSDSDENDHDRKSDSPFPTTTLEHKTTGRGGKAAKPTTGSPEKSSMHKFLKEDHKKAKQIKVKGKVDPDIVW